MDYITVKHIPGLVRSGLTISIDLIGPEIAQQLVDGALEPHVRVECSEKKGADVELITLHACECFGRPLKADKVAARITFEGRQSKEQKRALAEALLHGRLAPVSVSAEQAEELLDEQADQDELDTLRKQLKHRDAELARLTEANQQLQQRLVELDPEFVIDPDGDHDSTQSGTTDPARSSERSSGQSEAPALG